MAVLTVAAFLSKYNTIFADNTTRAISEEDMRDFRQDIADSFQSISGAVEITSWKSPCVVATTANITLSGEQTIDGVLTSGSRVLVKNQTTTSQNGIYVSAAGAWSRSTDADAASELEGAAVGVTQGTTQQNTIWIQTTDNITLGSSAIAWQQSGYGSGVTLIDDDTFATASATTAPSSESTKAYVDNLFATGLITRVETDLTAGQIQTLGSIPITIVAAQGANTVIELVSGYFHLTAGATPFDLGGFLSFRLANSITSGPAASLVTNTATDRIYRWGHAVGSFVQDGSVDSRNTALTFESDGADATVGNGTAKIVVYYRVVNIS